MKRTYGFYKQSILNYGLKLILIGISFLLVPMTLKFLGKENYGFWVTILSVISWANLSDFGLGNGLRNKLTLSLSKGEKELSKKYISTTYVSLIMISGILIFICLFAFKFLRNEIFKNNDVKSAVSIVIIAFLINFILGIYRSISYSLQKSSLVSLSQAFYSLMLLVLLKTMVIFKQNGSLVKMSYVYSFSIIGSSLFLGLLIKIKWNDYFPKFKYFDIKLVKDLIGTGGVFFIIQLAVIVLFSTDNLIITRLLGSSYVTDYYVLDKLFGTINMLFSILLISFWSSITDAIAKKDILWIKNSITKLNKLLILVIVAGIIIFFNFNFILNIWFGKEVKFDISFSSKLIFLLYTIILAWNGIYTNVVNGLNKLNLQMYCMVIAAILNIPLSIIFIKYFGYGIGGVRLATLICLLPTSILLPIQVFKIIKEESKIERDSEKLHKKEDEKVQFDPKY